MWVYENTLKIEYQATALSQYSIREDASHKQIETVKNPRRIETHFRSPQLDLWKFDEAEWLLTWRSPAPVRRAKRDKIVPLAHQLPLPEFGATG